MCIMQRMSAGTKDLDRVTQALASRIPEPLGVFARLAYNYRWAWTPDGKDVFSAIDPLRWRVVHGNPVRQLLEAAPEALEAAANNEDLLRRAAAVEAAVKADLERPAMEGLAVTPENPVAYFCAEFAIHHSLPIYSGGLGALAGDILKEASDLAVPMVAVGLLYREGYFRQRIDSSGWQHEYWIQTDPDRQPMARVTGDDGRSLTVTLPVWDRLVVAQIWRVEVGRTTLFLLDAERKENDPVTQWITSRLYTNDPEMRLAQYALLGAGGMRALEKLGIEPGLLHLNEGHGAFTALELMRRGTRHGTSFDEAFAQVRQRTVFTTHTPVPAGNDTYPADQVVAQLGALAAQAGLGPEELLRLGRTHPDDGSEPFGVTQFALRGSRAANGVAKRHGIVAREMWQGMWPGWRVEDVPIGHVTNGVHVPSWVGPALHKLMCKHLGEDWLARGGDADTWEEAIDAITDEELWAMRNAQRSRLVDYVRHHSVVDRLGRAEPRPYVEAAAKSFDPDALTVGFARRLATYKRLNLVMRDPARALRMLSADRPIQFVLAGKAHPRDDPGKHLVQSLFSLKSVPEVSGRVVFLDDYELDMAAKLVQGCDVWVNLPRPPLEASGTSGMKSAINGGLQLSVLDGWWWEAYEDGNGWALDGTVDHDHNGQDQRHAQQFYATIEDSVIPEFYDRDADGLPRAWLQRVRTSIRQLAPQFSATRMVRDYVEKMYR
jgi:starch phosphorylase